MACKIILMKRYLLDTSTWIYYFKKSTDPKILKTQKQAQKFIKEGKIYTCGQVLAEFLRGVGKETKKQKEMREMLLSLPYLLTTKTDFVKAADLAKKLDKKGEAVPLADCLIAAFVISHSLILVTNDNHFKRFKGLKLKLL